MYHTCYRLKVQCGLSTSGSALDKLGDQSSQPVRVHPTIGFILQAYLTTLMMGGSQ